MKPIDSQSDYQPQSQMPIAIIGLGCLFPKADSSRAFWSNIINRVDGITDVPASHWRPEDYFDPDPSTRDMTYAKRGGFLDPIEFDPLEFGISPRDIEAIDTTQLLGLVVAKRALEDAGYGPGRDFNRERTSVILGVTGALPLVVSLGARLGHPFWRRALDQAGVPEKQAREVMARISASYVEWQENSFPGLLGNVVAGRIANRLNLQGTNCVADAACASALSAVHLAALELAAGRADLAVTGGLDTFNDVFMYTCFSKTPALSPTGEVRPFDTAADGTILGEGLGVLVLKRLADAERDQDRIYAVISGIGTSSDGLGQAVYAPSSAGQVRAIRRALDQAGVSPDTIELIEAHGTGTAVGDAVELEALTEVYQSSPRPGPWCALGSVKSQIGHTKAAAGAAGLIKTAFALHHKVLPPTIKVTRPLTASREGQSPFYVITEKRPWLPATDHPRRAAVSAFGFGGSNFHVILEEHRAQKTESDREDSVQILAISAENRESLTSRLRELPGSTSWAALRTLAAHTRSVFNHHDACRLVMVIEKDKTDLTKLTTSLLNQIEKDKTKVAWQTPEGAYFGHGRPPGRMAMVFSGQGSQYVGMFRDLACRFPMFQQALIEADRVFADSKDDQSGRLLSDFIYPRTMCGDEEVRLNDEALKDTRQAQPALGAVGLGLFHVLTHFGLSPDVVAGHSYGELLALCAAGRYDAQALYQLSRLRGLLMAQTNGHQGAMLAVMAPAEEVISHVEKLGLILSVANKNTPGQTVLSGLVEEIDRATDFFSHQGLRAVRLRVSNAFHSPLMAHALPPFKEALSKVDFQPARTPVYANSTGEPYPEEPQESRDLLAHQLVRPVEFIRQIENIHEAGVRIFLEVGPGGHLTGLIKTILDGRPFTALAVDASMGKRPGSVDLGRALAHLAALGLPVRLGEWDPVSENRTDQADPKRPTFTVTLSGANQFTPRSDAAGLAARRETRPNPGHERKSGPPTSSGLAPDQSPRQSLDVSRTSYAMSQNKFESSIRPTKSDGLALREALDLTQQNMVALQKLQAQTAELHRQFLTGQEKALDAFQALIQQQQRLIASVTGIGGSLESTAKTGGSSEIPLSIEAPWSDLGAPATPSKEMVADIAEPVQASSPQPTLAARDFLTKTLLEVVAQQTGYPQEMLDLSMNLETDLGIDSIKRVEIFSNLAGRLPSAPAVGPEHLRSLKTLSQVVEFLSLAQSETIEAFAEPTDISDDDLAKILFEVVSQQTGYPTEMLTLDMNLETDLGIDSIKRVEIFSNLAGRLTGAPAVTPEHLRSLKTLDQVVKFLRNRDASPDQTSLMVSEPASDVAAAALLEIVAELSGYPVGSLSLDLNLAKDLGFDLQQQVALTAALAIRLPEAPQIRPEDLSRFETLAQIAEFLRVSPERSDWIFDQQMTTVAPDVPEPLGRYLLEAIKMEAGKQRKPITLDPAATIWITNDGSDLSAAVAHLVEERGHQPALIEVSAIKEMSPPEKLGGLIILAPACGTNRKFLESAFLLLKKTSAALRREGKERGAMVVAVSRLDGAFGLHRLSPKSDPVSGGLTGMAKTAAREWPEVHVKAVDINPEVDNVEDTARAIVEEAILAGPVEVGVSGVGRVRLELRPTRLPDDPIFDFLSPQDLVVITGGARGITAQIALALAQTWQPTIVLLGRSPAPEPEPDWLADLTDEAGIKRAILSHEEKPLSPRELEGEFRRLMAAREIRRNIEDISAAGSRVVYRSVDVRHLEAIKSITAEIRQEFGPVTGLIHGAGILADRLIEDKTLEEFSEVYTTKINGLLNLLAATEADRFRFLALFSSSTGRFGRVGQIDYAAANEVLNKLAQKLSIIRRDCRVISFNWGPWDGGMVKGGLKKIFLAEGIGLIPLEAGARYFVRELQARGEKPVEIVVLGPGCSSGNLVDGEYPPADTDIQASTPDQLARLLFPVSEDQSAAV